MKVAGYINKDRLHEALDGLGILLVDLRAFAADEHTLSLTCFVRDAHGDLIVVGDSCAEATFSVPINDSQSTEQDHE